MPCSSFAGQCGRRPDGHCTQPQLGQIAKTRRELDCQKSWNWLVLATVWQQISSAKLISGNGNDVNLLKFAKEKLVKITSSELILWPILAIWNHCEAPRRRIATKHVNIENATSTQHFVKVSSIKWWTWIRAKNRSQAFSLVHASMLDLVQSTLYFYQHIKKYTALPP